MVKNVFKKKHSRSNPTTFKKGIIAQQVQRSPMLNASKKRQQQPTIANVNRNPTSTKLPTIVKKPTPTIVKPIPTTHIPDPLKPRLQLPSTTIINESKLPRLLKPIVTQGHLPSIKEHTVKESLTRKATLKCKSPRPESVVSRSNTVIVHEAEEQTKNNHPLQHMDVGCLLSESARHRLKRLFKRLDTDKDGHLLYSQVQRCLPPNLPHAQMTFFRVLYDIISDTTFFGLQEFYATAVIVEIIAKQDSRLWNTYLDDVDFNYYHDTIIQLLDEFNQQCSPKNETISYENLVELIMKQTRGVKIEHITHELEYLMPMIKLIKINRLDFISLLPAVIYIQSCFSNDRKLFRFREHSILDSHMRQAILT